MIATAFRVHHPSCPARVPGQQQCICPSTGVVDAKQYEIREAMAS